MTARLASAGFIAADEEAAELVDAAGGDAARLDGMVARRLVGEPLAWITGSVVFCGRRICVHPGVYVPRWHTELLARRAVDRLPDGGLAIDVCTGSGAVAATLMAARPAARVVATDIDKRAVACARANGVDACLGDLLAPLPHATWGRADVVAAVVPYVPTPALPMLQRDTFTFESTLPYDGGPDGADILRRVLADATVHLRRGGTLLLELGGDQADLIAGDLAASGYRDVERVLDEDGDVRGIEARR